MNREDDDFLEDLMNEFRGEKEEDSPQVEIESKHSEPSTPKRAGLLQVFSEGKSESSGVTESIANEDTDLNIGVSEERDYKEKPSGGGLFGKLFAKDTEFNNLEEVTDEGSVTNDFSLKNKSGEKDSLSSEFNTTMKPKSSGGLFSKIIGESSEINQNQELEEKKQEDKSETIEEKEVREQEEFVWKFNRNDKKNKETLVEESVSPANFSEENILSLLSNREEEQQSKSTENSKDNFEDMLEGLVDEEEIISPKVSVEVDLTDPKKAVVTSDGKTLEEELLSLRGGKKKRKDLIKEVLSGESEVEVNGKKASDSRYLRHVKKKEKEREVEEDRIKMSMKFLQRNSNLTEQEKIIMKNLGVNSEQLSKVMRSKEITEKQKKEILAKGRKGAERYFKGRRYRTTVGDMAFLEFLVKFKFANARIMRWINKESQNRAWRKLNRLRDSGLVHSKTIIGIPDLFGATEAGVALTGYTLNPGLRPMPKNITISATMGINYIAACLWFNSINVLNLEDFPASNRKIPVQEDGRDRVVGEMLVSELEIRSSLGKEINPHSTTMKSLGDERLYDVISSNVREAVEAWEDGGRFGESPEFHLGNEYMWILYPQGALTLSYHVPDLVVKRDRGPNGEPNSIAVELERHEVSGDKYEKVMLAYKLDEHLYKEVVWVTPNTRTARALEIAAKQVGFTRYRIIPIITEDGTYTKPDIWMI